MIIIMYICSYDAKLKYKITQQQEPSSKFYTTPDDTFQVSSTSQQFGVPLSM